MVSISLFLAGLLATVALGAPVVSRLSAPSAWKSWRKGPSDAIAPQKHHVIRVFQPLDLGPDPMHWPSEHPWEASRIKEAEWPSKGWNDEHFGAHWRREGPHRPQHDRVTEGWFDEAAEQVKEAARAAVATGKAAVASGRAAKESQAMMAATARQLAAAQQAAQETARRAAAVAEKAAKVTAGPQVAQKAAKKAQQVAQQVEGAAKKAQAGVAAAQKVAKTAQQALDGKAPTREEIQQLVDDFGLAGAVKQIMDRTGWDFRAAAQYLSQNR